MPLRGADGPLYVYTGGPGTWPSPRDENDSHLHRGPIRARRANVKRFLSRDARPICYIQGGAYENTVLKTLAYGGRT